MSEKQEQMRPIPDGGLKDAMPSWLKRPPAWREMPTAEQRHERTLPEADTSIIDPHSLVDVSDLPQWLQSIAARGELRAPTTDAAVHHAVEVVQSTPAGEFLPDATAEPVDIDAPTISPTIEPKLAQPEQVPVEATPSFEARRSGLPSWIWPIALVLILAIAIALYLLI